jgi:hypothetical protein
MVAGADATQLVAAPKKRRLIKIKDKAKEVAADDDEDVSTGEVNSAAAASVVPGARKRKAEGEGLRSQRKSKSLVPADKPVKKVNKQPLKSIDALRQEQAAAEESERVTKEHELRDKRRWDMQGWGDQAHYPSPGRV